MASPPEDSNRKGVRKAIRRGFDRFKHAILPSSRPPSRGSRTSVLSAGVGSVSPAPSASQSTVTQPITSQNSAAMGLPMTPPTLGVDTGASLAPPTVNIVPPSPGPATIARLKEAGGVALSGLEMALRVLEERADVFPRLKSAIGGVVACLDLVQAATENAEEYKELTLELTKMAGTLNQYLNDLGSEDCGGSAAHIALSIQTEVAHIEKQQGHGKGRRVLESAQDKEDVIKRYHRIEGLFRQLQGDMVLRIWRNTNEQYVTTLLRGMSPVDDARYNSSYSTTVKRRGCTAETREKIQADLQDWVRDPNAAKVYWMNGMAGTGKTTIAYSLCKWLEENQRLGASFFCSRVSSSCRNVNLILPTIAYQLARYSPAFQSAICKVLKEDPDAGKLNVVQQFDKLMRGPMSADKDSMPEGVVIVIDALDECEDDYGVRLVLGTLLKLGVHLPVKFFVTSRPEPAIRDNMLSRGGYSPAVLHLHDIEQSIVGEDIKKYLKEALSSMMPPPSDEQIEQLARHAGKLFIYAATAVRYILPGKGPANPSSRLDVMLAAVSQSPGKERSSSKYKELDQLYTTILSAAFIGEEDEVEAVRLVLWTAVCAKEPMTILTLASLLNLTGEQVSCALQPLRSVLQVSEATGLVSTLHASFPDYVLDPLRSKDFHCDQAQHSGSLARSCFDVMREQLRFNICGLESSFVYDTDVPDLEERIKSHISPTLFYACRYWGDHLRLASASDELRDELVDFLTHKLLFWMEVLNLKLCVAKGISILVQAESWLSKVKSPADIQKQASDTRDFVTRFAGGACGRSTPHIYLSALPFCAKSSSVYAHYWDRMRGVMDVRGTAMSERGKSAQATWVTGSGAVFSVAFSADGTRIISGSEHGALRVWDAHTGDTAAGPFQGHTSVVRSVAFSPDGTRVVSGSWDNTIRVWDAQTGDPVAGPFQGHIHVNSVAFSPDGTRIASAGGSDADIIRIGGSDTHTDGTHTVSGSYDNAILVWDSHTGDVIAGPFKGHTRSVNSIAFSPDGTRIVSSSEDKTIRVWDVLTGNTIAGPFQCHTYTVNSVAFSPDGTRIVSGSSDMTIRVLDAHTGDTIAGPFQGHKNSVESVAFSPDGTRLVSGSSDNTIRVWDANTGGTVAGPFQGHISSVRSVAFSPDGTRIVSGSSDGTIRVWDPHTSNDASEQFQGHTSSVRSVAFSPDGTRIVSGSGDWTARVWDSHTGENVITVAVAGPLLGHLNLLPVYSVAFSPDGARIVSGSTDDFIPVIDAHTGNSVTVAAAANAGPFRFLTASAVPSVAFSPDGTRIVSGSANRTIGVWDAQTGDAVAGPFQGHTGSVNSVEFSPDGARVVSGSSDKTIRVWDALTGNTVAGPFQGHTGSVNSVEFSPDGVRVVSGSSDKTILVWDAHTGDTVAGPFQGHTSSVESVAFSPNGTRIVSGSSDMTIRVWDTHTGDTVAGPFQGHTDLVWSVAFSPDGTRIVSGSGDKTIRVWAAHPGNTVTGPFQDHEDLVSSSAADQDVSLAYVPIILKANDLHNHVRNTFRNLMDFKINADGWITTDNALLFWAPSDLCTSAPSPHNVCVIGPQGTLFIDFHDLLLGKRWSECYVSQ